jgi:DNA-binding response OmpR family regulator
MKNQIAIITDDMTFTMILLPLLSIKINRLQAAICESFSDIESKVDEQQVKLIIIDGGIKRFSSIEMIHYLRVKKRILVPIWFFPEIQTAEYLYKSKEMGANKIILKPFDPYQVTDDIEKLLENRLNQPAR